MVEACSDDGGEEGRGSLLRDGTQVGRSVGARGESVGSGGEHALSQVGVVGVSGDAKVTQHGVRFPAPEELDHVGVHSSTEQGGGPTGAEAAGAEQSGVDASGVDEGCGGSAKRISHRLGGDVMPEAGGAPVGVDWGVRSASVEADVVTKSCQGLDRAQAWVRGGQVADLLAPDRILLVVERESCPQDAAQVQVIQRRVNGSNFGGCCVEGDVAKSEGLRAALTGFAEVVFQVGWAALALASASEVFGGPEEPEEADDGEVDSVLAAAACGGVAGVQGDMEVFNDGDVCRMGSFGGVVVICQGFEERSQ